MIATVTRLAIAVQDVLDHTAVTARAVAIQERLDQTRAQRPPLQLLASWEELFGGLRVHSLSVTFAEAFALILTSA